MNANKLESIEEMHKFPQRYNLLILSNEERDNLNRPVTRIVKILN